MAIQPQNIWKPQFLRALGAGFRNDATLRDGIHLRWTTSPNLGLPFRRNGVQNGEFIVERLKPYGRRLIPIRFVSLFESIPENLVPIVRGNANVILNPHIDGEDEPREGYYFRKLIASFEYNGLYKFFATHSLIEAQGDNIDPEDKHFLNYLYEIHNTMRPETYNAFNQEICEAVAVDMSFEFLTEIAPGAAPLQQKTGCLGLIARLLGLLPEQRLARVNAYNKNGKIVDSDWVGRRALDPQNKNQNRTKNTVQLRAAGIYYVKVEQNPGVRIAKVQETRFIFCHDYCRADLWQPLAGGRSCLRLDEESYENQMIEHFYKPFQQEIDVDAVTNFMRSDQMINAHYFDRLAQASDTYAAMNVTMGKSINEINQAEEGENDPEIDGEISEEQAAAPLLSSFVVASVEPAIARIMGNYYYAHPGDPQSAVAPDQKGATTFELPKDGSTDFRIRGFMPFFGADNLNQLREKYAILLAKYNVTVDAEDLLRFFDLAAHNDMNITPCGLVLADRISEKPSPEVLDYSGIIGTTAVPDRIDPDAHELIVNANLIIPTPDSQIAPKPWETIIGLSAERRINHDEFTNTSEEENEQLPQGIGILPPLKMVDYNHENGTFSMRDFFFQALLNEPIQVSYRVRGFDIFGRPSAPKEGGPFDLPIPCFDPQKPLNLNSEIDEMNGSVTILSTFSLLTKNRAIEADATHLEILIYELPENAPDGVMGTRWVGVRNGIQLRYSINNHGDLDFDSEDKQCAELQWALANNPNDSDRLVSNPIALNACSAIFPEGIPTIEQIDALPTTDESNLANPNEDVNHYQFRFAVAEKNQLEIGEHFYAVVMRILAKCTDTQVTSGDIMSGARLFLPPPPPELVQPPLTRIPLSTYPDKNGQSYFQVDLLSCLVPINANGQPQGAVPADNTVQIRIYRSTIDKLDANLDAYVNGDFYVEENGENVLDLVRSDSTKFELLTAVPLVYSAAIRHHKIHVNGNVQKYHVIAVEGVTLQLNTKPWKYCAFYIFKTPTPLLPPSFSQIGTQLRIQGDNESAVELNYYASFPTEITGVLPKVQIKRYDLTLGKQSFVNEAIGELKQALPLGVELPTGHYYAFQVIDLPPHKWHKYRYEATMLYGAPLDDTYIKHPTKLDQEILPLTINDTSPFENAIAEHVEENGNSFFDFNFAAGEYGVRVKVVFQDDQQPVNYNAEIKLGAIFNADPSIQIELAKDSAANNYKLRISDNWSAVKEVKLILRLSSSETASNTIEL